MRIKYCFIFLLLFPFYTLFAQEDPRITMFPWLQPYYNAGAMGEKDNHLNFTGLLRQHAFLMKVLDSETSGDNTTADPTYHKVNGSQFWLNVEAYVKQIRGAIGVMFLSDKAAGIFDNSGFKLGYATKIRVQGGKLGIGLQLGFLNMTKMEGNNASFTPNQPGDPTVELWQKAESSLDFDMSFGVHYKAPNWYAGISASQLLGGAARISGEKKILKTPQQLYFSGGYIWDLRTPVPWSVEPSVLIRSNLATWSLDLLAVARYNGILWFGMAYQLDWSVSVLFGAVPFANKGDSYLKGLEVGVSYSFPTARFGFRPNGSMGDFEIMIRYGINFYRDKPLTGYGSSRHLYKNQ